MAVGKCCGQVFSTCLSPYSMLLSPRSENMPKNPATAEGGSRKGNNVRVINRRIPNRTGEGRATCPLPPVRGSA